MSMDTKRPRFQTYVSRQRAKSLELSGEYQRLEGVKEILRLADEVERLQEEVERLRTTKSDLLADADIYRQNIARLKENYPDVAGMRKEVARLRGLLITAEASIRPALRHLPETQSEEMATLDMEIEAAGHLRDALAACIEGES